jgi:hypothetical protein
MKGRTLNRRRFFTILGAGGASLAVKPLSGISTNRMQTTSKPSTNISDAAKNPRTSVSMPGKFPGKVILLKNTNSVVNDVPVEAAAYMMLQRSMLELTGQKNLKKAWRMFVKPGEKIGLKVNPVAGKLLFTSHAVVQSVVKQLTESGIDRNDIIIWDRRDMELKDTGFTKENYPGIVIRGTELQDENVEASLYTSTASSYPVTATTFGWATGCTGHRARSASKYGYGSLTNAVSVKKSAASKSMASVANDRFDRSPAGTSTFSTAVPSVSYVGLRLALSVHLYSSLYRCRAKEKTATRTRRLRTTVQLLRLVALTHSEGSM